MRIIGIDPGTATTGYAVIELQKGEKRPKLLECSHITTPAGKDMHRRLEMIYNSLTRVINNFSPDLMVIERLFFNTNVKTAMTVGQARGVPLLVASQNKMTVFEYTALEAKHVLTGYGRSTKKQMQSAVMEYMNLTEVIKPDDANDALAMALCFLDKDCKLFGEVETIPNKEGPMPKKAKTKKSKAKAKVKKAKTVKTAVKKPKKSTKKKK